MNRRRALATLMASGIGAYLEPVLSIWAADSYPSKPIKIIVPASAGGGSDFTARLLSKPLSEALKQSVIVDNRPGAAGDIGALAVVNAAPDGYTLLLGHNGIVGTNPHVSEKLSYDVLKDLVPVAPMYRVWAFFFVPATSSMKSFKDFIQAAKSKPGTLNYGSSGIGSLQHVGMEWLKHIAGIDVTHVPYKGSAPATTALLAGEIDVTLDFQVPAMEYVKAGKLKVFGVASNKRLAPYPDIPTLIEQGIPGFTLDAWVGIFAPAGTPRPIVERLNLEIAKALKTSDMQEALKQRGAEELHGSSEEFAAFVKAEYERGAKLVKISGAKVD